MPTPPFWATSSHPQVTGPGVPHYSQAARPGYPLTSNALSKVHFGPLPSAELSPEPSHQPLEGQTQVLFIFVNPVIQKESSLLVGTQ